jgi:hypothetical protein
MHASNSIVTTNVHHTMLCIPSTPLTSSRVRGLYFSTHGSRPWLLLDAAAPLLDADDAADDDAMCPLEKTASCMRLPPKGLRELPCGKGQPTQAWRH